MRRIAALVVVIGFLPAAAAASQQGLVALKNWQTMDKCAKLAQAAFPDPTPEALAQRDAALNECLRNNNLPPRAPLAQPPR